MVKKEGLLIDVRTSANLLSGKIYGAINIDFYNNNF